MIKKKLYKEISKKWKGRIYHKYHAKTKELAALERYAPVIKGKDVLEVGCNAGLLSYTICQHAKSYVGLEKRQDYYEQALVTLKAIENPNATFVNKRFKEYVEGPHQKPTAFFASYVMYHMRDAELDLLKTEIFPHCDTVLLFNRNGKREHQKNRYRFERLEDNVAFLSECGFNALDVDESESKFHVIVGRK